MSFNFVWRKRSGEKLLKGEFLKFLKNSATNSKKKSSIRFRFRTKKNRKGRFEPLQKFFKFDLLPCIRRIRGGISIKDFFDIFFWVRFLENNPYLRNSLYHINYSETIKNNRRLMYSYSFMFSPLTRASLNLSRHFYLPHKKRLTTLYKLYRHKKLRLFLIDKSIILFMIYSFSTHLFRYTTFEFESDYIHFLSDLSKFLNV